MCATCTLNWSFRRVACAYCGEERPTKLGYFHTPEYDHIRIEACDSCRHYIKGVDLTRLGFARFGNLSKLGLVLAGEPARALQPRVLRRVGDALGQRAAAGLVE